MTNGGTLFCGGFNIITDVQANNFIAGTGTIDFTASNTLPTSAQPNAANFATFNNLTISAGTTTLAQPTTVNGTLNLSGGASADLKAFSLQAGAVTGTGAVTNSSGGAAATFTINNAGADSFAGTLTGNLSLTKSGAGTLTLSGNSTYSGGTTVSVGILNVQSNTALGTAAASVSSGAALQVQGGFSLSNALTLKGTGVGSNGALENVSGNNTFSGVITLGSAATIGSDISGNTLTLSGVISGGFGLTKTGAGTLTLSGANTFGGAITVTVGGGILSVGADNGLGNAGNTFTLSGGTLQTTATFASARGFTIGAGNGTVNVAAATTLTLSGIIAGANSLTKTGTGILVLSGANTFGGAGQSLTVFAGTLTIGAAGNLGNAGNTLVLDDGTTFSITAITNITNPVTFGAVGVTGITINIPNNTTSATPIVMTGVISGGSAGETFNLTGNSDAWLSLAGANTYVANLVMANATNLEFNSDASFGNVANTLIMTNNNAIAAVGATAFAGNRAISVTSAFFLAEANTTWVNSGVVSGTILNVGYSDASGAFTGTVELSGNNTFNGTINVWCGTLALDNNQALGLPAPPPGSITVNGGTYNGAVANAALMIAGNVTIPQNISTTANGASTNTLGSLSGTTGTFSGTVTMGSNTFFAAATGSTVTFSNTISGAFNITAGSPTATGTLSLSGVNAYTGATTVNAGTLLVDGSLAAGSAVAVNATATLGGRGTINGTVTSTGGTISPGDSPAATGILATGATVLNNTSTFVVQLNGAVAGTGYDRLNVAGAINLGGSALSASLAGVFFPVNATAFTIITSTGALSGTFAGLANNAIFPMNAQYFQISYTANSVVLTRGIRTLTALVSSANPSVFGQSVTFTATVSATTLGAGTPTGTVNFFDGVTNIGSGILNGAGVASFTTSALSVSAGHSITAVYGGDANYITSTSAPVSQAVNKDNTSTAVTSSVNPSVFGQAVAFTATVGASAPGSGTPSGTVNFFDGVTNIGSGILNGAGVATFNTNALAVSPPNHSITAVYGGDGSFNTSTSANLAQVVNQDNDTTLVVSSSANPSVFGQPLTFTVNVTANAPGAGTPTGTIQFVVDGVNSGAPVALAAGSASSASISSLSVGNHTVAGVYSGDADFKTSTSLNFTQTVNKANIGTVIASSADPSVYLTPVTFTATASAVAPGAGTPTGTLQFTIDGVNFGLPVTLAGGIASSASISSLVGGNHNIAAVYSGDVNFNSNTSPNFIQTVNLSVILRQTADANANGKIDAIRILTSGPLNDNFGGLTVTVAGYTVTGYDTGLTANDNEFFVRLAENVLPPDTGDTATTPSVQIVSNTTLASSTSGQLLPIDGAGVAATDGAPPVLLAAEFEDIGSFDGVDSGDEVLLIFSEPVTVNSALISDIGLPVAGDSWDTSTLPNNATPNTYQYIMLGGNPILSPGGVYLAGVVTAGSPTGVYINSGSHITGAAGLTALNQTVVQAVDLRPGMAIVALAWSDESITPKTWNLGVIGTSQSFVASTWDVPQILTVMNSGNVREQVTVTCSNSVPSGWVLSSTPNTDKFSMLAENHKPLIGTFNLDLSAGPQTLVSAWYSGQTQPFDLKFFTPTLLSSNASLDIPQTIVVTLTAMQN